MFHVLGRADEWFSRQIITQNLLAHIIQVDYKYSNQDMYVLASLQRYDITVAMVHLMENSSLPENVRPDKISFA